MSRRSARASGLTKADYGLPERSTKRRKVVSYKEESSGEEDFSELEPIEDDYSGDDVAEYDNLEEEKDFDEEINSLPKRSSRTLTTEIKDDEKEEVEIDNENEDAEEVEEDIEEAEDDEESERDESKLLDEEDEIENDQDLVREERIRMRKALSERRLQEEKRLVLNKLLKRRVGANRGEKKTDGKGQETNEVDEGEAADEMLKSKQKHLPREKLPRRIIFSADGGIVYKLE
ncbi:hypothetical protein QEN19_004260 [Hanseniaspora menglaensis]